MQSHLDQVSDLDRHVGQLASFLEHRNECLQNEFDVFLAETFTSFNLEVMLLQMTRELELLIYFEFAFEGGIGFLLLFENLLRETEFFT